MEIIARSNVILMKHYCRHFFILTPALGSAGREAAKEPGGAGLCCPERHCSQADEVAMPATPKCLLLLPALAALAACDPAPYRTGPSAYETPPPPDMTGTLGGPQAFADVAVASNATPVMPASPLVPAAPLRMSAPEVAAAFTNNTAEGVSSAGQPYAAYFTADGVEHFRIGDFDDRGRWRILPDGRFCTSLSRLGGGESCYVLYRSGPATITFETPGGLALGNLTLVRGDAS